MIEWKRFSGNDRIEEKGKTITFTAIDCQTAMATTSEIAVIARQILEELNTALETGEEWRWENHGIGLRLRSLLTMTASSTGPVRQARLTILTAIKRTEIGDEIRRGGACHTGAERSVQLPEDADLDMLADGLRQLASLTDNSA